jgi:glycine cleavage system H protein
MAGGLLYSADHAWVRVEGRSARVGISEFAQSELGEIAFIELPEPGRLVRAGEPVAAVDSLKSSSELVSPLSGTVTEANGLLEDEAGAALVNKEPTGRGWLFVLALSDHRELDSLMSETQYERYVAGSARGEEPASRSR